MVTSTATQLEPIGAPRDEVESVVVRFAGDSGDGMQLTGSQFTLATALAGNDLATFPDFPAEIRAPIGTTFGVSAFQINFGARKIATAGDAPDVLVAMNPAALKVNLGDVKTGGTVIVDSGTFTARNLKKAGFDADPLADDSLDGFQVLQIDISKLTTEAVKEHGVSNKEALRSKNMWTLGLIYWLYDRDRDPTVNWLRAKFGKLPNIAEANVAALNAGHIFGETAELPVGMRGFTVRQAEISPGLYRAVTGAEALAWGLAAGAKLADLRMVLASYPITPASNLLHILAGMKQFDIVTFQAEDEIAAVGAAIGASFAGSLGVTSSSGPGVALKGEAIGLAISTELPLIIVNSQRAGPSTGLPTKTEQSDLFQSVYGRNADAPLVVLASSSPSNCFDIGIEAVRLATKYMTPVILLSDGYMSNASEPWLIPDFDSIAPFPVQFAETDQAGEDGFMPFTRDATTLARPWAKPGTPGLEHRIGGIEKQDGSGNISYDADNHQRMTDLRAAKINGIAKDIPELSVEQGNENGKLAVVGWGSTYGPISRAVGNMRDDGYDVSHVHLHHIWPMPQNTGELLAGFDQVLVPEMNNGQLVKVLRAEYLTPAQALNKVNGQPFKISEIEDAIKGCLDGQSGEAK
ncbi:MAG: 2-oxoacid:acceptor oxidoreductase subunit alpha [Rhodospirillaceae bacterium]|jgi:2-oxoglutarate ferredoxin oxidoreductase subunit alpha|nr:2-oxoacid:acceptor oxidoreductase subunit alpha [Rhodospirillaceae bacterium]MBT4686733.1 2-oxoacid:acceptor oxidoreductase subunit alpha [Rhodospirillaceae bacterium]MBT5082480.1 2-oxoacid:acceptor oxidoreductase subunit alpha [Rhodospirillaceae bacterium]MBT5523983.1 2-oxoacid:acceptor oxidoreductase subunit alpha [Rhodospirillaceae bacterium]MBT5882554.1 2-oxoacid:acceptor oxidoreductase subunit alpha [Rhodospirillaceae bacterium]